MIEKICPSFHLKYNSLAILGPILEEFAKWLYDRGYKENSISRPLRESVWIDKFLGKQGVHCLSEISHDILDKACCYYQKERPNIRSTIVQIKKFLQEKKKSNPSRV